MSCSNNIKLSLNMNTSNSTRDKILVSGTISKAAVINHTSPIVREANGRLQQHIQVRIVEAGVVLGMSVKTCVWPVLCLLITHYW